MGKKKQIRKGRQLKRHVKKGDTVKVLSGNDKGKEGRVLEVYIKENRAVVEGINIVTKSTKPTNDNPQGGLNKQEAPVHLSNLMVIDPSSGEPTRIGRKKEKNKLVRYSKKTGEIIE